MCMKQNSLILIFLKKTTEILDVVFKKTHRSVLSSLKTRDEAKSF